MRSFWTVFLSTSEIAIIVIYRVIYIGLGLFLLGAGTSFLIGFSQDVFKKYITDRKAA